MNARSHLDAENLRFRIASILLSYPELAEDEVARIDTIEGETNTFEFLEGLIKQIEDAEAMIEGTHNRIAELREREARFKRRVEALRSLILSIMQVANIPKAELSCATLSVKNQPPKLIELDGVDPLDLPDDLCRVRRDIDRTAVRQAVEAGRTVPGFIMSNGGVSLQIRK